MAETKVMAFSWPWMVRRFRIATTRLAAAALLGVAAVTGHAWPEDGWVDFTLEIGGMLLVLVALIGRSWCTLYIAGRKDRVLVTDGPYALSRNPLYFFSALGAVGVAAATETLTFVGGVGLLFALYYPFVIQEEEKKLLALHGERFEQYRREVPAFFPRWKAVLEFREGQELSVNPLLFRKHLFSVVWFVLAFLVVHSFERLREMKVLPVYWHLY
ncbi:isoprenylcysteine carboxylmethyltransferase family protein [Fontisphaera persica]|uniref:methyltransferase family protein n=1 Tax=Fontisphaera persica TaxID=2974023 RepID=UPI0024C0385D|nr:isoprenylcysteine carboxylmethyltransferase family protein [Fontisphaera persica]WCJ58680.1 isoprenylcysteine carboxylmethyltransferase family protein [Fontisphaera persica]